MKRTSILLALLFGAMLWFSPAGAQQKTRPIAEDNGTEMKMDKVPPMLQKQEALSQETIASFENTKMKMVPKMNRVDGLKVSGEVANLSEDQQKEMVKAYMRQAIGRPTKAGSSTPPSIFLGPINSSTCYFTVSDDVVNNPTRIGSINNGSYYCYPYWGAWCGDHYEALFVVKTQSGLDLVGYFAYDFVTDELEYIGLQTTGVINSRMADYDATEDKIYVVTPGTSDITIYESEPWSGTFTQAGTLTGVASVAAMAIDKTGKMYMIGRDGNLYTVNKETWVATLVGSTGIDDVSNYGQSAAFDYRSQKLYWAYDVNTAPEDGIAVVDVTTGQATIIENEYYWISQLACVFYVDENPAATALGLSYNGTNVIARFTAPEYTVNGDPIDELNAIEIYKYADGFSLAKKIDNPVPGQKYEEEIAVTETDGTLTYVLRTQNKAGKYSSLSIAEVRLLNIALPYTNGFEENESDKMENITLINEPETGAEGCGITTDEAHTGTHSYQLTGDYYGSNGADPALNIEALSVKRGGVYQISFYYKPTSSNCVDVYLNGKLLAYNEVKGDEGWLKFSELYVADATGQIAVLIGAEDDENPMYIDDIEVKELVSPDVPAAFDINSVTAAANGVLQAVVNITLPDKTMGDETLSKIDSIEFYFSTTSSFTANNTTRVVVKEGLTPGATTNITVDVPKAGNYYVRAMIYNEKGSCPYYSQYLDETGKYYQKTPWIGSDMPASVKVTATPGTDGTVTLEWLAPTASHQGYIGTVTYKLKDAAGTQLYNGTDLTFTTAALDLGMHTFTFEMTNGIETKTFKANTLAGIQDGMIYSNVAASGTYEGRVLNVSATATNSAFSQMLYPATNQAMYIDTLLLFATAPETGEATQDVKIYMGTTDLTAFGGSAIVPAKDFVEKDQLTEVFAGTLRFKAGESTLKLPLKGFYYDGTKTLVIGVVKPMQEPTTFAAAAYVAVSEGNMLKYRATSTEIDFDTVKSYNDYTGTPNGYAVSMVAAPGADLKTLKVTVDSMGVTPLEGAIVTIVNKGGKNMKATITTGADGTVSFAYMPQGVYTVKAQRAAYIASEQEVTVGENSPVEVSFSLIKAKEVKVSGTVQDKGGNKLADVTVKAAGLADFTATTNADGEFELQGVYGPGEYTLLFEKAGMKNLSAPFELGEKDTTLAEPFEMGYNIMDVPMASVAIEDGGAVVNWTMPSVSTTVTWTPTFTQMRRLTIDNETPFKYAQRFLPEDLEALKLGNDTKALRFGFIPGSETAQYNIVLASDTTHEIYRAEVPADKLKVGEWCDIDIPAGSVAIDVTKELWLIVEVSGEDQNYPCAATTTGTVDGKGNLMNYNNKWSTIKKMFTNGEGNVLIRLLVEDASTQVAPANGYRVYRGLLQDEFKDYTLLTQQTVNTTTYTDAAYAALPFGQYNYAVVSDWYGDDLSKPTYTNTLNKDMEFTVIFKVTSNAGSAKDAYVYMVDTARTRDYDAEVNDKDTAAIAGKVWRGVYDYEVSLFGHQTVLGQLDLTSDTVIKVELKENIVDAELTATVEGFDVVMNYGVNLHNWFDDVESYKDFAIENIGDYILSEPVIKGGIKDVNWTNAAEKQSWIVFNPSKTNPAMNLPAHSGNKMFAAFYNAYPEGVEPEANSDYLIRPVSKGGGEFIFYCRAYAASYPEAFEVVYSSTTADLKEFKAIKSYKNVTVTSWTPVVVKIPENAKYIGVHCISKDAFVFLVDDLAYYAEDPANPTGYELYLDGNKVKEAKADELTYTMKGLSVGEHKVGVKAIYASGASKLVEKTVNISAEAAPIKLNVEVEEGMAVLTWDMPEGFAPKSYKVFLGEELKAENVTEKTYTFNDLENGKYTAAVVAVYETGESEKATVEFEIKGVDVEDFGMAVRSSVYPNPNNGMFYLQAADKGMVEVYTMNGQMVKRMMIPAEGVYTIDLQNRAKGMYLVRFMSANSASYFKVMVR